MRFATRRTTAVVWIPARALAETFARILAGAEKLRKCSVDDEDEVIDPRAFAQSIKLREGCFRRPY
jgi:hypothetical protein